MFWRFHKASKVSARILFVFLSFLFYLISSLFLVAFFKNFYIVRKISKGYFPENFGKFCLKFKFMCRWFSFIIIRFSFWILRRSDAHICTAWLSNVYYLIKEKRMYLKNSNYKNANFCKPPANFSPSECPKTIANLSFHDRVQFVSFAFRNFNFLGRFRNTVLF